MNQKIRCMNCKHVQEEWYNDIEQDYIEVRCDNCGKRIRFKVIRTKKETMNNGLPKEFKDIFGGIFG